MKEQFQNIPAFLRRQILIRLAGCALGGMMILFAIAVRGGIYQLLPGIMVVLVFMTDAATMFYRCIDKRYVVIRGVCEELEYNGLRKRLKSVLILCDGKAIKVFGRLHNLRSLKIGDSLEVYIADTAPVYEQDGIYVIMSTLAVRSERKECRQR